MASNSFKIKKSLNIEPNSSPTLDTEGDVGFNSTSHKLQYRDNSATRNVVTEDGTQTLTNKTITSPSGLTKSDVGLGNVDNTSDATKNSASVTLTNKTISGSNNTITNVSLTTGVTGTLPLANGGTGQTSASAAFGALSPLTTKGDLLAYSSSNARFPVGSNGQYITADSAQTLGVKWTSFTAPTVQKFTSGSGTYTTPSPTPLYIVVEMVGGGAGGNGGGSSAGGGGAGGNTTFGTTLLAANGGASSGGAPGSASLGTGPVGIAISGGYGAPSQDPTTSQFKQGGSGGASAFGGAGRGGLSNSAGLDGLANTGGGGGGGGTANNTSPSGTGGSSGGYVKAIITSPTSSYAYAVGAGGTAGTSGTGGLAGGAGGSGIIVVTEYYT
jgi:hypothetical protein